MDKNQIKFYYEAYSDMVYRLGFTYMKNKTDAEDVVQETFLRLVKQEKAFASDEHVKAWLIVTATNYCKSLLAHWWNKREDMKEENTTIPPLHEHNDVLDAILALPVQLKTSIYLYYYEGYSSKEIAKILKKPDGTIRSYLHQGRVKLKDLLQEGDI